jgi:hypothetical protein
LRSGLLWVEGRVPIRQRVACPGCGAELVRKPGGRCPACNTPVAEHVQAVRDREERIERVVAVVGTFLVAAVLGLTAGVGLIEGALAYAGAGAVMFYLARKTF